MMAPGRPAPKRGRSRGLFGVVCCALAAAALAGSLPASRAAAQTVVQLEAEDFFTSHDVGGIPIHTAYCTAARGYLAVDGLDCPGDYIEWQLSLPEEIFFLDSLRSGGAVGLVREFVVQISYAALRGPWLASDTLVTPPGAGIWCGSASYDWVRSSIAHRLFPGDYVVQLRRRGAQGETRVDFLDLVGLLTAEVTDPPGPGFALLPPKPNPAGRTVELGFSLPSPAAATLGIYDVGGRLVSELASGPTPAGDHRRQWDLRDGHGQRVQAGVYFARLGIPGHSLVRRLAVLP